MHGEVSQTAYTLNIQRGIPFKGTQLQPGLSMSLGMKTSEASLMGIEGFYHVQMFGTLNPFLLSLSPLTYHTEDKTVAKRPI